MFSAGDEAYLRETDGEDDEPDEDEFHAFYVEVKGDGQADLGDLPAYYRVDGGTERPFSGVTQEAGNEARYHIDLQDMAGMTPGLHEIEVYVNDEIRSAVTPSFISHCFSFLCFALPVNTTGLMLQ